MSSTHTSVRYTLQSTKNPHYKPFDDRHSTAAATLVVVTTLLVVPIQQSPSKTPLCESLS